jgi:hypothetical protein
MTTLRRVLTATALAAMASSVAMANSIDFSHTTPSTTSPFTNSFSLANFNTALGTLTSVTITLAYSTTGEVDIFNDTSSNQTFTNAESSVPLTLTGPDGLSQTVDAVAGPISGTVVPGENKFPGLTGTGTLTINVPSADFGAFEIPPSATTDTYSVAGNMGTFSGMSVTGVFFGGEAVAGGVTTVTYDYVIPSATPEPTTMVMMGAALVGLGLLRKKSFKKS